MNSRFALALMCVCAPCWAQTAAVASAPPAVQAEPAAERGEPNVKHIVIEDDGSKIDELRVRGQTQHVVVTPKVGVKKSYEIIVSRNGRAVETSTGGATSATGKRVWNVLDF